MAEFHRNIFLPNRSNLTILVGSISSEKFLGSLVAIFGSLNGNAAPA